MARSYLPAGPRSATAVDGVTDRRDENVYSAVRLQNTAQGSISMFTQAKSGQIPALFGTSTASTNAWQTIYGDNTTNLEKAGELGDGIGDIAVRGIALHVEEAGINTAVAGTATAGNPTAYGATQLELADLNRKVSFELKISKKPMFKSPFFCFPSVGGAVASLGVTTNAIAVSTATNGRPGAIRKLITHIMVSRRDTIEGVVAIAGGSSLLFRTSGAGADGIPMLLWGVLPSSVRGDAR